MSVPEPPPGVTLKEAAAALGCAESTIRRYVKEGAPCVRPGEPGRGKGALVNVGDLQRWLRSSDAPAMHHAEWLGRPAEGLLAFHRERQHRLVSLNDPDAAALYHDIFAFIARRVGADIEPDELRILEAVARQGRPLRD